MKDKKPLMWIPIYIDKHLFGSTRQELEPDERSVWMDLLVFSGKDDGHVRANEGVPYPNAQLAGIFLVPEELLNRTIKKCIKYGKINILKDKTMYLPSWKTYPLSDRHIRRLKDAMSAKPDMMSAKPDAKRREEKNREENINIYIEEFNEFWEIYNLKIAKQDAEKAFKALRKKDIEFQIIKNAVKGYANHLYNEKQKGFDKQQMYPATFLRNEKWKDFVGVKRKTSL